MMVCRFFLGVVEAGLGLGVPYYLSFFYLRYELGFRCGIFLSMAPLASTFAGALAFGITSGHSTLPNWKLLFIIEGVPSIVLGAITFFCLPDTPEKARFLSEEQKVIARARGVRQVGEEAEHRLGHLRWSHVIEALLDWKNWVTAVSHIFVEIQPYEVDDKQVLGYVLCQ
jgi:sugar phosphate permease